MSARLPAGVRLIGAEAPSMALWIANRVLPRSVGRVRDLSRDLRASLHCTLVVGVRILDRDVDPGGAGVALAEHDRSRAERHLSVADHSLLVAMYGTRVETERAGQPF